MFSGSKTIHLQHQHSAQPGYVKLPKSPYLWSQHKAFGIQEITCFSQGLGSRTAMGLLLRAEEGREQMRISTVVCPAVIKHGSTRPPLCVLPPELHLDSSICEPQRSAGTSPGDAGWGELGASPWLGAALGGCPEGALGVWGAGQRSCVSWGRGWGSQPAEGSHRAGKLSSGSPGVGKAKASPGCQALKSRTKSPMWKVEPW